MTKTKTLFTRFNLKISLAAARYRDARTALLRLDPNEDITRWKEDLQELRREDIRGPSREKGETSESCQKLSWIWSTPSLKADAGINDPKLQEVMRVEWCKAVARAERFKEEVELTVEEMRRCLVYFEWNATRWEEMGRARDGEPMLSEDTIAGLKAYAARQAALYHQFIDVFIRDWYECLELKSLSSEWLSDYPRPEIRRRRRLPSNVRVYHPSASTPPDEKNEAVINDPPSDPETDSAAPFGEDEIGLDFFDEM